MSTIAEIDQRWKEVVAAGHRPEQLLLGVGSFHELEAEVKSLGLDGFHQHNGGYYYCGLRLALSTEIPPFMVGIGFDPLAHHKRLIARAERIRVVAKRVTLAALAVLVGIGLGQLSSFFL